MKDPSGRCKKVKFCSGPVGSTSNPCSPFARCKREGETAVCEVRNTLISFSNCLSLDETFGTFSVSIPILQLPGMGKRNDKITYLTLSQGLLKVLLANVSRNKLYITVNIDWRIGDLLPQLKS